MWDWVKLKFVVYLNKFSKIKIIRFIKWIFQLIKKIARKMYFFFKRFNLNNWNKTRTCRVLLWILTKVLDWILKFKVFRKVFNYFRYKNLVTNYYRLVESYYRYVLFDRDLDWKRRIRDFKMAELKECNEKRKKKEEASRLNPKLGTSNVEEKLSNNSLIQIVICIFLTCISMCLKNFLSYNSCVYFYWCITIISVILLFFFLIKDDEKNFKNVLIIFCWSIASSLCIVGWGIPYVDKILGFGKDDIQKKADDWKNELHQHHLDHKGKGFAWKLMKYVKRIIMSYYYYSMGLVRGEFDSVKGMWDNVVLNIKFDMWRIQTGITNREVTVIGDNSVRNLGNILGWRFFNRKFFFRNLRRIKRRRKYFDMMSICVDNIKLMERKIKAVEYLLALKPKEINEKIERIEQYKNYLEAHPYIVDADSSRFYYWYREFSTGPELNNSLKISVSDLIIRNPMKQKKKWIRVLKKSRHKINVLTPYADLVVKVQKRVANKPVYHAWKIKMKEQVKNKSNNK